MKEVLIKLMKALFPTERDIIEEYSEANREYTKRIEVFKRELQQISTSMLELCKR
jgi:hypothetical protein